MTSPGGGTRQVRIVIAADVANAIRGFRDVEQGLGRVGNAGQEAQRHSSSFSDTLKRGLEIAGVTAGFGAIVGGFKAVISTGLDYESSMHTFQAVTGANVDVMRQMGDTAKAIGNDVKIPGASAQSTAAAMTELAKGGLNAQQAMDAARGTMILAAAAQIDGAQAAEIQANALNTFGLKADQAGRVANVLANVANKSSGEINDFALGLAQAGTVASTFGWSIEDTTTMLGLMANAGIKGSDAGTSLKTTMTAMLNPSASQAAAMETLGIKTRDATGHLISATDFTAQLTAAKGRMSEADFAAAAAAGFGTDAVRTALVAAQAGTKGFNDMAGALSNQSGASDVAAANSQGLTGALDRVSNTASTVALTLYQNLAPALTSIVDAGTSLVGFIGDAVDWFTQLPGPVQATALAIGAVVLLNGPLKAMFASIVLGAGQVLSPLASMRMAMATQRELALANGTAMGVMSSAMRVAGATAVTVGQSIKAAFLSNPIGLAIIGVTTALSFMSSASDDAKTATEGLSQAIDSQTGKLTEGSAAVLTDTAVKSGAAQAYKNLGGNVADYVDALGGIPGAQEKVNRVVADAKTASEAAAGGYDAAGAAAALSGGEIDAMTGATSASNPVLSDAETVTNALADGHQALAASAGQGQLASEGMSGALGAQQAATQGAGDAAATATEKATPFKDALKAVKDAAQEADDATQFLNMTLLSLAGSNIDAETAQRANAAAMRGMSAAARSLADAHQTVIDKQDALDKIAGHVGETLNGQAVSATNLAITQADVDAATRALADAKSAEANASDSQANANIKAAQTAVEQTQRAYDSALAQGGQGAAIAAATQRMQEQRDQFIANQPAADQADGTAAKLADHLGLIPANVTTTFAQPGINDALANMQRLNADLDKADNRTVRFTAIGTTVYQYQTAPTGAANANIADLAAHADGGWVSGAGGPTDDKVGIRVSPKEFVVRASQAQKYPGLLEAINNGAMGFADGGAVPDPSAAPTGASAAVAVQGAVSVPDVGAIQAAWTAISTAVQTAWAAIIGPALDALAAATAKTTADWVALQTVTAEPVWTAIGAVVADTVNTTVLPNYAALDLGTATVGAGMASLLNDTVIPVWSQTGATVAGTWAVTIAPTYDQLNAGSNNVGATFGQLAGTTAATWGQIGSTINATYTGQIVPAWTGVQSFTSAAGGFFTGVQSGVSTATGQITGDIGQITTAIDGFFGLVDSKAPATTTPTVTASLGGSLQALADGGPITAGTGPRSDDVLVRASKGEYIVNAAATAKNRDTLDQINYGGAFADGGLVGDKISGSIQSAITAGAQKAITAGVDRVVAASTGGVSTASGYNASQDPSSFGWVRASNIDTGYSWNGFGFPGGVAKGTEGLWNALLTALVPQIPGGLQPGSLFGYENRDNVNSPGKASFHSYGLALDVNASANPNGAPGYGRAGQYVIPSGPAHALAGQLGMEWGGDFGGTPDPMHFEIHVPPGGISAAAGGGTPAPASGGSFLQGILDRIKSAPAAAGGAPAPVNGGVFDPLVERWRSMVEQTLTFIKQPISLANTVLNQMRTESSGDENAINLSDVNAQRGDPSIGLIQVIGATFRDTLARHGLASLIPRGQRDPFANLVSGELYSIDRYGSIAAGMRGVAYDNGGPIPPGFTLAYNGTGQTEMGLTNSQWQTAGTAINHVTNMAAQSQSPQVINVNYYVDGKQFDGRAEVIVNGKLTQLGQAINRMSNQVLV